MKKLILAATIALAPAALAETGTVKVENNPQVIQSTVDAINSGRYRGHLLDNCNGRRKVYKVEISNGGYRVDRYGNLQPVDGKAIIKYRCNGSDD